MGAAAILVLLGSNIRQRKLRQIELRSLAGTTEDMLDQSIERVGTTLRHNRFTLVAMGPVMVVGVLLASAADRGSDWMPGVVGAPAIRMLFLGAGVVVIAGIAAALFLAVRRGRRELERLQAMRESYRREHESSAQ
jgi:hypothetical protein